VLGLEVVLASGEVLEIGGALEKNNTGLDLRQLFIGTEGTLGVVTEATLKLCRPPEHTEVLLFAAKDLAGVLALFREVRNGPFTLQAFEFFTDRCLARVERHRKLRPPLEQSAPCYVLCELEGAQDTELDRWLVELFERGLAVDGTKASSPSQAAELWALREGISESLAATGFPYKNDVALPIAALEPFCAELNELLARDYPGYELCLFGHIGDGNLHVNVMQPEGLSRDAFLAKVKTVDQELFALVQKHRGSISAEHGIGLLKKPYLHFSRSLAEIASMKAVKRAIDPLGILNPGKIFDV
jgi:FAD/FMN-containing dehydrogenase